MSINDLKAEREKLQKRMDWLGIRSTGSERIEQRIREIDRTLSWASNRVIETPNSVGISMQGKQG